MLKSKNLDILFWRILLFLYKGHFKQLDRLGGMLYIMRDFVGLIGLSGFFVFLLAAIILIILSIKNNQLMKYMFGALILSILCLVALIANIDVLGKLKDQLVGDKQYAASVPATTNDAKKPEEMAATADTEKQQAFKQKIEQDLEKVKAEIERSNAPAPQVETVKQEVKNQPNTEDTKKSIQQEPKKTTQQAAQKQAVPENKYEAANNKNQDSDNAPKDEDDTFIIKRGQSLKVDTVNLVNNMNFRMVIFSKSAIGVQSNGIVTSIDGKGNPVVTKTDKPFFSPVEHSPYAEVVVDPSYIGGLSFLSGEGGPFDVIIRAAPNAKIGEYRAYVKFQWAREGSNNSRYTLMDKEYKFKIVN